MRFIGRREGVAPELLEQMDWAEEKTAANDRITLFVAFNYGGRGGDPRRGASATPAAARRSSAAALRARDARPRPDHPHQRRAAHVATTCCGRPRTPSSSSATSCGRTSPRGASRPALGGVRERAGAGSGAAEWPPPRAARAGARRGATAARTWARGSSRRSRRSPSRCSSSSPGGWSSRSGWSLLGHRLPARAVRDVRPRPARRGWRASSALVGLLVGRALRRRRHVLLALVADDAADVPARASPSAARAARRAIVGDDARHRLDRARRSRTPCCCATCRTATRSSSTCSSARSSATPAPTSAAARSARAAGAARSRRTRPSRACVIGIVVGDRSPSGSPGLYQDWLLGPRRAAARPRGRARRAARRPVRVATSSATRARRTPGTLFGAHGGALDRLDAVLFTRGRGYYVWLAML